MRKVIYNVLFYTGFGYLILSIIFREFANETFNRSILDFLEGFAIAIMLVGVVFLVINRYSSEGAKRYEIEENDERNIRIKEKAGYLAWYATFGVTAVMCFIFIFILDSLTSAWIAAGAAVLHRIIFEIFKAVYKKKM